MTTLEDRQKSKNKTEEFVYPLQEQMLLQQHKS